MYWFYAEFYLSCPDGTPVDGAELNGIWQPSDGNLMMCSYVVIHDIAHRAEFDQCCNDMRFP